MYVNIRTNRDATGKQIGFARKMCVFSHAW